MYKTIFEHGAKNPNPGQRTLVIVLLLVMFGDQSSSGGKQSVVQIEVLDGEQKAVRMGPEKLILTLSNVSTLFSRYEGRNASNWWNYSIVSKPYKHLFVRESIFPVTNWSGNVSFYMSNLDDATLDNFVKISQRRVDLSRLLEFSRNDWEIWNQFRDLYYRNQIVWFCLLHVAYFVYMTYGLAWVFRRDLKSFGDFFHRCMLSLGLANKPVQYLGLFEEEINFPREIPLGYQIVGFSYEKWVIFGKDRFRFWYRVKCPDGNIKIFTSPFLARLDDHDAWLVVAIYADARYNCPYSDETKSPENHRVDLRQGDLRIDGLEEIMDLPDNNVTRFVKAITFFLTGWIPATTFCQRLHVFVRFLDDLVPLAKELGLFSTMSKFRKAFMALDFVRAFLRLPDEQMDIVMPDFDVDSPEDLRLDGSSNLTVLNEELVKLGYKPITRNDFSFFPVGEQMWLVSLICDCSPTAFEYTSDFGESKSSIRDKMALQVLRSLNSCEVKYDAMSVLNELLMANGKKPLSKNDINCVHDGVNWNARCLDPISGDIIQVSAASKKRARLAVANIVMDTHFRDVRLDFSIMDAAQFIRSAFNSAAIASGLKLVSLAILSIFICRKGEFDMKMMNEWLDAKSVPDVAAKLGGNVMDHIIVLLTCSQEFFETHDWRVFMRNDNEVNKFMKDVVDLREEWAAMPSTENPADTMANLIKRVEDTIAIGAQLSSTVKVSAREAFQKGVISLRHLRLELIVAARSCTSRMSPFAVLIDGPPKIGKSSIISLLHNQFRLFNPKKHVVPTSPDLQPDGVYTRTLKEPYWSAWQSWFWAIVFDDLGQTNPKVPDFALEINELIQVNNNVNFFPPMADVESKGKVFVAPQLLIATTNNRDLNAYHAVSCPSAVWRRLPFIITPKVKTEFHCMNGGLDGNKVKNRTDVWTFKVDEVRLIGKEARYDTILQDVETSDLLLWFNDACVKHFESQKDVSSFNLKLSGDKLCEHGVLSCVCSRCADVVLQSTFSLYDYSFFLFQSLAQAWLIISFFYILLDKTGILRMLRALDTTARALNVIIVNPFGHLRHRLYDNCISTFYVVRGFFTSRWRRVRIASVAEAQLLANRVARLYEQRGMKLFFAIATFLTTAVVVASLYSSFTKRAIAELNAPLGEKPVASDVQVPNAYAKGKLKTFPEILGKSASTGKLEDLKRVCETAFGLGEINGHQIRCLNVFGNCWLFPKHFIRQLMLKFDGTEKVDVTYCKSIGSSLRSKISCYIDASKYVECPDSDFAILRLACAPGRDLLPWILDVRENCPVFHGDYMRVSESGIFYTDMQRVTMNLQVMPKLAIALGDNPTHQYPIFTSSVVGFVRGDCGSVLLSLRDGILGIAGFHVASKSEHRSGFFGFGETVDPACSYATALPKAWLEQIRATGDMVIQGPDVDVGRGVRPVEFMDLHYKCPLRFEGLNEGETSLLPLGTVLVPQQHFKSSVKKNIFAPFWESNGYSTNKVVPDLQGRRWLPKRNFLLNATTLKDTIPLNYLRKAASNFLEKIVVRAGERINNIVVLDEETTMYGLEGDQYINCMDFTTGAGFPYNQPKHKVLRKCSRPGFPDGTYALTDELRRQIAEDECRLEKGERANFIFNASLKDEPISEKKLAEGKIRVFQALNFSGLFLLRKYFLSFVAFFQTHNLICENAVGLDHSSPDWDYIYRYLRPDKTWKAFCGDYSNFDQRMGAQLLEEAWKLIIVICLSSVKYPREVFRLLVGLTMECIYICVNYFGDFLIISGTNPSGHALTVVINSIVNSIYIRLAWLAIFSNLDDFDEHVRLIVYGDDNVVSVHPRFQREFNLVTVSNALAMFGVVYGDAAKTGILKEFNSWDEITFLKRYFVEDAELGCILAPIELASIHKMLIIGVDNKKVCSEERLVQILRSSLDEMFHHGKEAFHKHRALVDDCVLQYGLKEWVKPAFMSYDEYKERRLSKSSRIGVLDDVMNQRSTHDDSYQGGDSGGAGARSF